MGFVFNRQLNMLSAMQPQSAKKHKKKQLCDRKIIRDWNARSKTHRLSAKDIKFLKLIGLRVRRKSSNGH